jgi:uncharacterized protein YceK
MTFRHIGMLVFLTLLSGCGTIHNLDGERRPYGGLALDVRAAMYGSWFVGPDILAPMGIIDAPFSAVGDTVTLPITVYSSLNERFALDRWYEEKSEELQVRLIPKMPPKGQSEPE